MMTLRQRLSLIIGAIIIGIIILLLVVFREKPQPEQVTEPDVVEVEETIPAPDYRLEDFEEELGIKTAPVKEVTKEDSGALYLRQIARIFTERFGTYSTHNETNNTDDIFSMATDSMITYMKTQEVTRTQAYTGATLRVISSSVSLLSEDAAEVEVAAQEIVRENGAQNTRQKEGVVKFVKQNGDWKVNGLYWNTNE